MNFYCIISGYSCSSSFLFKSNLMDFIFILHLQPFLFYYLCTKNLRFFSAFFSTYVFIWFTVTDFIGFYHCPMEYLNIYLRDSYCGKIPPLSWLLPISFYSFAPEASDPISSALVPKQNVDGCKGCPNSRHRSQCGTNCLSGNNLFKMLPRAPFYVCSWLVIWLN